MGTIVTKADVNGREWNNLESGRERQKEGEVSRRLMKQRINVTVFVRGVYTTL